MGFLQKFLSKKILIILTILLVLASIVVIYSLNKKGKTVVTSNKIAELAKPTAVVQVNQPFEYKITDPKGGKITLKYTIVEAKKVGFITLQNQPINLKSDEEIMIIDLELQNDSNYPLTVNSRDFVRLIGTEDKRYAPDFYNQEQDVAPISVKKDQIAFIIKKDQKQFRLEIGEIDKEKTPIEIKF